MNIPSHNAVLFVKIQIVPRMDLSASVTADATIGVSNKGYASHGYGAKYAIENAGSVDNDRSVNVNFLNINERSFPRFLSSV